MATYSDPDRLDELTLRTGADIRSPLLRTLVDLYLQKPVHSAEEERHFTELALRLLDQADADTCAAVSRQLAAYPSVPAAIARRVGGEVSEAAAPAAPPPQSELTVELSELFFTATAAERRLILANLGYATGASAAALTGDAREAARQLEAAALAHNPDAFMRALNRWLGLTPALARRIVSDPLGEPIVVVAKVVGIRSDAVQRILLFLNPAVGRSVSRVYELAALFDTIDPRAAHLLVEIWRAADPRPAAPPQSGPAERGARRVAAHQAGQGRITPAPARTAGRRAPSPISPTPPAATGTREG